MLPSLRTLSPFVVLFGIQATLLQVVKGDEPERQPPPPAVLGQACIPEDKFPMGGARSCNTAVDDAAADDTAADDTAADDMKCHEFGHEHGKDPRDVCVKRVTPGAGLGYHCFDLGNDIKPGFWKTVLMEGSSLDAKVPNVVVGSGSCALGHECVPLDNNAIECKLIEDQTLKGKYQEVTGDLVHDGVTGVQRL